MNLDFGLNLWPRSENFGADLLSRPIYEKRSNKESDICGPIHMSKETNVKNEWSDWLTNTCDSAVRAHAQAKPGGLCSDTVKLVPRFQLNSLSDAPPHQLCQYTTQRMQLSCTSQKRLPPRVWNAYNECTIL